MTFKELKDCLHSDFGRINFRETLMLRKAFDLICKSESESKLHFHIIFEDEKKRDDYDLVCSACGALFHCEDENQVNGFIETNNYCCSCGRKLHFVKETTC